MPHAHGAMWFFLFFKRKPSHKCIDFPYVMGDSYVSLKTKEV